MTTHQKKNARTPRAGKTAHGHLPHMTGAGVHDSRPRTQRTRSTAKRTAITDQQQ